MAEFAVGNGWLIACRSFDKTTGRVTQQKQEIAYRFCFNSDENDPFSPGCDVCIHPMFFEYLNIKHEEPYVVNQLVWEMFY